MESIKPVRLAILVSHPIQYQTPLFKLLAKQKEIDLTVYFCWNFGVEKATIDKEFEKKVKWDIPMFGGYRYKFIKNIALRPSSEFFGQINPSIVLELYREKYDALLVFGWNGITNWLAFLSAMVMGIPVYLRGENPLSHERVKSIWKRALKRVILGTMFKGVKGFFYIGEENKKFYQYYGVAEEKLFFTPYAVDNSRLMEAGKSRTAKRKVLRKELNIGYDDVVILFAGKLIEKKRPLDLLKAYEKLVTSKQVISNQAVKKASKPPITKYQVPVTHLLFVGAGPLRPALEKYVKKRKVENTYFIGFKNQTELPKYYAIADIFVLPSGMGETWGLVVNEAMCFGLPVIVSDLVGCARDLVREGENGYQVPFGDVEKLARRLKELADDKEKRETFGKVSRTIIQQYSYDTDVREIVKVLTEKKER